MHRARSSIPKIMKFAILFVLVAAAIAEPIPRLNPLSPTGRIVGGEATSIDQVPYQVSLQVYSIHICGASIISANHILTAAHCMVYPADQYSMRTGSTLTTGGGSLSTIAKVIIHEKYSSNAYGIPINDVAIIHLSSPLTFDSNRAAIKLYASGQEAVVGAPAVITGWGTLTEGGSTPTVLQTVTVPIVSKADCSAAYAIWGGLPVGQICAAVPKGGKDACQGDSGGPLAINGTLAGIVSWGNGCARPGYPGAYTEIAHFRDWISRNSGTMISTYNLMSVLILVFVLHRQF